MSELNRRELLEGAAALGLSSSALSHSVGSVRGEEPPVYPLARPKLAVILTQYGAGSHGVCYCTKLLEGKQFETHFEPPLCDVVAIHLMEIAKNDVGVETAKRYNVPMYPSVATALCRGGNTLAVDGVVLIGEHGTYPSNEKGQQLYPRREIFDQIVAVFRESGQVVPVFNDKHLSWNWEWAKTMWKTVRQMKIPWMAGSSLPFSEYVPKVALPHGKRLDHVIGVGYGGLESYGFHALETGQFVVEKRAGGESGVRSVQVLRGEAVWEAHRSGRWPRDIAEAALGSVSKPNGSFEQHRNSFDAFDIEYRDGQRMTVFMANGYCQEFAFAYRVQGKREIVAASYELDALPRLKHFSATTRALEEMYISGRPTAPSARTTLTTGILAYGMESAFRGGVKLETPDLNIRYSAMKTPSHWKEVLG